MGISVSIDVREMSRRLLGWWEKNQREFPWRRTKDPYKVLLSEIMLHRTKAEQVTQVYAKFFEEFPSMEVLSKAKFTQIKKILYPLGLHWRTQFLYEMSHTLVEKFNGVVPSTKKELLSLPGVSDYIASAVLCFSFDNPVALLDTNIVRILGRLFGMEVDDRSRRSNRFQNYAIAILDKDNPRSFNFALIDLGALVCTPKKPACCMCPLTYVCKYGRSIILGV